MSAISHRTRRPPRVSCVRDDASPKALRSVIASLQTSMVNQDDKTVTRVGMGIPIRWKVVG